MLKALVLLLLLVSSVAIAQLPAWERLDSAQYHDVFVTSKNQIYAYRGGTDTFYRSDDGCKTWIRVTQPIVGHNAYLRAEYFDTDSNCLILGSGESWNDTVFAISRDNGVSWNYPSIIHGISCRSIVKARSGRLFALMQRSPRFPKEIPLIASDDHGVHWYTVLSAPETREAGQFDLIVDSIGALVIMGQPSWRSEDEGETWSQLPADFIQPGSGIIRLAVTSNGTYLQFHVGGYYRSTNFGMTWDSLPALMNAEWSDQPNLLTSIRGEIYTFSYSGPDYSLDDGKTWISDSNGLTKPNYDGNLTLNSIAGLSYSPNGYLYASTLFGMYRAKREALSGIRDIKKAEADEKIHYDADFNNLLFAIDNNKNIDLIISDLLGREIFHSTINKTSMHLHLPVGSYIANAKTEESRMFLKFEVLH